MKGKKEEVSEESSGPSGEFVFPNNDRYKGEYQVNEDGLIERSGFGTHTTVSGVIFTGEWVNDKLNGTGSVVFPSGAKYEGEIKDNQYDGKGTYTWPSGSVYKGEFVGSKLQGSGVFSDDLSQTWVGQFHYKAAPGLKFQLNM